MIKIQNINQAKPYLIFHNWYSKAQSARQDKIEACCVASYSMDLQEVNARYINIKYIIGTDFIFFTNYNSPKSKEFISNNQITAVIYWNSINLQIRLKANINQVGIEFNNKHFKARDKKKNALAISSNQSKPIDSYSQVEENYYRSLESDDLKKCPEYWGGFSFTPYYFEFWEGHESRINKREVFNNIDGIWKHSFLQP